MAIIKDLTNQRFERLVARWPVGRDRHGHVMWLCNCDCSALRVVADSNLRHGNTRSCGCFSPQHNRRHGMRRSLEYTAYANAKARCTNPMRADYRRYCGRGIQFKFESFEQWYAELGPKPSRTHSVDRINNNGHYEVGNVRWATWSEQNRNRRPFAKVAAKELS